jgi:hypothetical protein
VNCQSTNVNWQFRFRWESRFAEGIRGFRVQVSRPGLNLLILGWLVDFSPEPDKDQFVFVDFQALKAMD